MLCCPLCGENDHKKLGALVSARTLEQQRVDVCDECRRYVKIITTLTPIRPEEVALHDLATLVLDVAALEREYFRPTPTHRVGLRVVTETSRLRELLGLRS
jgi:FdhE protein